MKTLFVTLTVVFSCFVSVAQEGFPRTVTDGADRELVLDSRPERVVALYNDNYGMLATLDIRPVGVFANDEMLSDPIYFDGAGGDIAQVSFTDSVNLEEVAALKPDLIMAYSPEEAQAMVTIAPVYLPPQPDTLEELYDHLRNVASLFGEEAKADVAITAFQNRYKVYQQLAPKNISVLKLGVMDEGVFYITTIDDPLCQMLNTLARCDWQKETPDEYWGYETTLEGVLALDPDVILLNNWTSVSREDMLEGVTAEPLWNELKAVQTGRVIGTPGYENPIASSLPAAQKFLDVYLPLIYPDIFPEALTDEQVQEILGQ